MSKMSEGDRDSIENNEFAFRAHRKAPLSDAAHLRNAIARFNQVEGVTNEERDEAWKRIKQAAKKHDVELNESDWRDLQHSHKKG